MIHVFIGTKAQYIKTAPVCRELSRRGVPWRLIDSGQHRLISEGLRSTFGLPAPDVSLREEGENLSSIAGLAGWFASWMRRGLFESRAVRRRVFADAPGICVIHGDTATTLLSCILARRAGLRVAHLEAGLRSRSLLHPFPEELIRILTMRRADLLFAPNDWAAANLRALGVRGRIVTLSGNTGEDAVRMVIGDSGGATATPGDGSRPYVLVTCHRVETIYSRSRLGFLARLLLDLAKTHEVRFVMHEPTRNALVRFGLLDELSRAVRLQPLLEYPEFLRLIRGAAFVISDGGSIQEESYYLNVPCLIMRHRTERIEGLEANAVLSEFNPARIADFIARHASLRRPDRPGGRSPSEEVVDVLIEEDRRAVVAPDRASTCAAGACA